MLYKNSRLIICERRGYMTFDKKAIIRKYKVLLKNDVTSFLVSFRRKYKAFPIKLLNELSRKSSYNNLKKLENKHA